MGCYVAVRITLPGQSSPSLLVLNSCIVTKTLFKTVFLNTNMMRYSFLPEDGHCRSKHVAGESCIYKLSSFYSFVVVERYIVNVEEKCRECSKCFCELLLNWVCSVTSSHLHWYHKILCAACCLWLYLCCVVLCVAQQRESRLGRFTMEGSRSHN